MIARFAIAAVFVSSMSIVGGCSGSEANSADDSNGEGALHVSGTGTPSMVFDCKTDSKIDDKISSIKFSVQNMGPNMHVNPPTVVDENDDSPVKTTEGRLSELNDNLAFSLKGNNFTINGDSDGVYLLQFRLYKDSGFKHGFVAIKGDEKPQYSKVTCDVTEKSLPTTPSH